MPVASRRDRGGGGEGGRGTAVAAAGATDIGKDASRPRGDDGIGGDITDGVVSDAERDGSGGGGEPVSAGTSGDDTTEVDPEDGDGGGSVTLLPLVLTGAREEVPDVPIELVSNGWSGARKASAGDAQRGELKRRVKGAELPRAAAPSPQRPPPPAT